MQRIIVDFGRLELFGLDVSLRVFGYGLMLVFGFLTAISIAQRTARRAGEPPRNVAHCGLLALVAGVIGARIAYIIENYEQFAQSPNPVSEMINITSGGLIYYGGVVLAGAVVLIFLRRRRLPIRRYLDIIAPSLMIGLAFGRAGCTLNGCCYGERCDPHWPLAMRFPLYSRPLIKLDGRDNPFSAGVGPSPVFADQLVPAPEHRLVNPRVAARAGAGEPVTLIPIWDRHGPRSADQLTTMLAGRQAARQAFAAIAGDDGRVRRDEWLAARKRGAGFLRGSEHWSVAVMSDADGDGRLSFDEAWDYLRWRRDWLERRFGPLDEPAAADRANAALQADELTVRPVSVDARLVNWPLKARWQRLLEARARKAASASDRRVVQEEHYPLLPPQELHPALDGDQLVVLRGTEASARELFARAAGGDDLMDQRDWDRALASGDGLLRGSEHWSEASANARAGRLRFADVWAYLQWRRDFLERKFGPLDDAGAAARANAYLQADEQALAAAARSLPVKPAQPLGIVNALLLAGLLMGLYRLRTREGQVFAVLLVTYPITRFFLEMVRSSGHDLSRGVLTHNQYTSMIMVVLGAALLVALHRMTPSAGPAGQQRSGASSQPDSSKPRKGKK